MKKLILLSALLASGCDDPEAASKAAELLEFGVIRAKAVCPVETWSFCSAGDPIDLHVLMLADGSCMSGIGNPGGAMASTIVWGRAETESATCDFPEVGGGGGVVQIISGSVVLHKDGCSDRTHDIETECSGYNLEAFD